MTLSTLAIIGLILAGTLVVIPFLKIVIDLMTRNVQLRREEKQRQRETDGAPPPTDIELQSDRRFIEVEDENSMTEREYYGWTAAT